MLDRLPRYVWDSILREHLSNDPHVLQNLSAVSKGCHECFKEYFKQSIKLRMKVPYITQPGTDLYVYLHDSDYCYAPMRWTDNHVWVCDMLLLPSPLASFRYHYEVITTTKEDEKENKIRRAEDQARPLNALDYASFVGKNYPVVLDDRWGVVNETHKYKHAIHHYPGCIIGVINDKLVCDCKVFAAYQPEAEVQFITETYAVAGNKIAQIQYANNFSRTHTLHLGEVGKEYYCSIPVNNGLCGRMNIIAWQDKIITDGDDCTFEVRDWYGFLERSVKLTHSDPLIARVNWVHSFQVWNDHLVTVGHGMIYLWNKDFKCIRGWRVNDASQTAVVWNNLLAVSAHCKIQLFTWEGKCVQVLSGHTGYVGELVFKDNLLVSCGGVNDDTIRVWDSKGSCFAVYLCRVGTPRHVHIWKNALYASPARADSSRLMCFAWPWGVQAQ